jgi:hypothetical protein
VPFTSSYHGTSANGVFVPVRSVSEIECMNHDRPAESFGKTLEPSFESNGHVDVTERSFKKDLQRVCHNAGGGTVGGGPQTT